MEKKDMTIWGTVVLIATGGGGWASYDRLKDHAIEEGNKVWVSLESQSIELRFAIEDELAAIQRKVDKGIATEGDRIRRAVLEERLRQLEK